MSGELRGPEDAERWLCAGLCLARQEGTLVDTVTKGIPALLATLAESSLLPPPAFVLDLGHVATGAPLSPTLAVPDTLPRLRSAVRAYEDHLLARLAAERHLEAVAGALARLPEALRPRGVAFLVTRLLSRLGFKHGTALSPALARRVLERPAEELVQAGYAALRESTAGVALERLADAYEALASGARRAQSLLGDAEVFTLENLAQLQGKAQRLALEQAVEAAEELSRVLPPRMRPRPVPAGRVPTALEDEAAFPQGGFASVSNVGSIENLVTSELVYMEDDGDLDLFDLRYVEGELLYYTRDESIAVRRRRVVTFALQPGLADARVKDAGVRWQRGVLALGLVLCLVRRLSVWLADEDLRFRVIFVRDGDGPGPLEAERGLCELLLREWRARGTAEVLTAESLDAVLVQVTADAKRARVDVLLLDARPAAGEDIPRADARVGLSLLDLSGPSPRVIDGGPHPAASTGPSPVPPWEAWTTTVLELAQGLL